MGKLPLLGLFGPLSIFISAAYLLSCQSSPSLFFSVLLPHLSLPGLSNKKTPLLPVC